MARRGDHSREELKHMIYAASRNAIAQDGVEKFSTRKLAKLIGYSAGIVYSYHPSLDSLIMSINAKTLEELNEIFVLATHRLTCPKEKIKKISELFLQYARDNRNLFFAIFNHRYGTESLPDWYQERIDKIFSLWEGVIEKIGVADPRLEARLLWSNLYGITVLCYSHRFAPTKMPDHQMLLSASLRGLVSA